MWWKVALVVITMIVIGLFLVLIGGPFAKVGVFLILSTVVWGILAHVRSRRLSRQRARD